jgi:ssDNA-binding Zn-finger/Zn-ribbon topoisomerase 1
MAYSRGAKGRLVSCTLRASVRHAKEESVARKTVLVCDNCGNEVEEAKGAVMRVTYTDARRGAKQADLCDSCAGKMPGRAAARRGRKPKSAAA